MKKKDKKSVSPLAPVPLDGFSNFEGIVMGILEEEEKMIGEGQSRN